DVHAARAPRRGPDHRQPPRAHRPGARRADPAVAGRLPRQPAASLRRQRLHLPRRIVPAAPARGRGVRGRNPDDHGRQPSPAPDARLTHGARSASGNRARRQFVSVASTVISTFPVSAREIGQPSLASFAAAAKLSWVAPGTTPRTTIADESTVQPASRLSPVMLTSTSSRWTGVPALARLFEQAIEKHEAC